MLRNGLFGRLHPTFHIKMESEFTEGHIYNNLHLYYNWAMKGQDLLDRLYFNVVEVLRRRSVLVMRNVMGMDPGRRHSTFPAGHLALVLHERLEDLCSHPVVSEVTEDRLFLAGLDKIMYQIRNTVEARRDRVPACRLNSASTYLDG